MTSSSGKRSQLAAHASHTSVQISHVRRCLADSRTMNAALVAHMSPQSRSVVM
jgi:hypothetical protein